MLNSIWAMSNAIDTGLATVRECGVAVESFSQFVLSEIMKTFYRIIQHTVVCYNCFQKYYSCVTVKH